LVRNRTASSLLTISRKTHKTGGMLDISEEELQTNRRVDVPLNGDAKAVLTQLLERAVGLSAPINTRESWWGKLRSKCEQNIALIDKKMKDKSQPLKYHYVLSTISKYLPRDAIIINEGANTMDIGRVTLANHLPRTRLDAGTLGTMGVGAGYAIASAVSFPNRKVVAVVGDSAFGFSGFETEVAVRYDLPITFFVINNNGIYCGESELKTRNPTQLLPTSLTPNTRYDLIMTAFGGTGYYVTDAAQLEEIIPKSLSCSGPSLVNIIIDSQGPTPSIVNSKK